jgi:hypothetical protein
MYESSVVGYRYGSILRPVLGTAIAQVFLEDVVLDIRADHTNPSTVKAFDADPSSDRQGCDGVPAGFR